MSDGDMFARTTPLLITYDEAPNIRRVIEKLLWARRIVVVDSGSKDGTLDILRAYPQVDVIYRPFVDFASQCNFGLRQVDTPWVLSLDADYDLSDELVTELEHLVPSESTAGFRARFVYRTYGRALRGTLYPPRTVLYRKELASYQNEGHGHRVVVRGNILELKEIIFHDDRKPLSRWILSQQRYAREEASYLFKVSRARLSRTDKIRLMGWPAPILILFYTLFAKGCILDGWPGWHYALQRSFAETLIALEIVDRRLGWKNGN
jgi:glycosyltransferase involved in cell wall biosynthesis